MTPQKPTKRAMRERIQRAFIAALAVEDWPQEALPATIDFRRFCKAQYRTVRGASPKSTDWHVTIGARIATNVLGGWQIWHLYASEAWLRPSWNAVSESLAARLEAISNAAWAAGIRRIKVKFDGPGGLTAHQLIALQAEADSWPSTMPKA